VKESCDSSLSSARRRAARVNAGITVALIGVTTICPAGISVRFFGFNNWILRYMIRLSSIDSRRSCFYFDDTLALGLSFPSKYAIVKL
jgi:hypothetical protein